MFVLFEKSSETTTEITRMLPSHSTDPVQKEKENLINWSGPHKHVKSTNGKCSPEVGNAPNGADVLYSRPRSPGETGIKRLSLGCIMGRFALFQLTFP